MATISVIVPIYKVEKYLDRCVKSILAQTYRDFVLILVDDGSPDKCGVMCDQWAEKDTRITVLHQKNAGLSAARNAGIEWTFQNTDCQWIAFIDSDDWVAPTYLEVLYGGAKSNNGISCVARRKTSDDICKEEYSSQAEYQYLSPHDFWKLDVAVVPWGKLYPIHLFRDIRYPIGKIHEDKYVTHLLVFQCEQVVYSSEELYFYFQRPDGITGGKNLNWNKNTLFSLEASRNQFHFFKKIHDEELAQFTKIIIVWILKNLITHLDRPVYLAELRRTLREIPFSKIKYSYFYAQAYPCWKLVNYPLHCCNFLFRRCIWRGVKIVLNRLLS